MLRDVPDAMPILNGDLPAIYVKGLTLREAWDLEETLDDAKAMVSEYIDGEILRLVADGWTQTRIAEECGRAQQTISRRMARLGIEAADNRGRFLHGGVKTREHEPEEDEKPTNGREVAPPMNYLPDLVHEDSASNVRTQAMAWYGQGRRLMTLLEDEGSLVLRSDTDRRELRREADHMIRVARRLKEAIRNAEA